AADQCAARSGGGGEASKDAGHGPLEARADTQPDVPAGWRSAGRPAKSDPLLVPGGDGDADGGRRAAVAAARVTVTVAGEAPGGGSAPGRADAAPDRAADRLRSCVPRVRLPGPPLRRRDCAPDPRLDARPGRIPGRVPRGTGHQRRVVRDRLPALSRLARVRTTTGHRSPLRSSRSSNGKPWLGWLRPGSK